MDLAPYRTTLETNLGLAAGQRLAVVTDTAPFAQPAEAIPDRPALARALATAADELGVAATVVTYAPPERSGVEPPRPVWEAVYPEGFVAMAEAEGLFAPLLDKTIDGAGLERLVAWLDRAPARFDAVLALSRYSITHTRFRKLLSGSGKLRAATMPGVEPAMFTGVMTADWPKVAARSTHIAGLLSGAARAEVRSAGGRSLRFGLEGRSGLADTGLLDAPGSFGNLPGGEAFIAPVEGSAEGELAVGPREDPERAVFVFAGGELREIQGETGQTKRLSEAIDAHPKARNLAELGVGTNEAARAPDNILEAEKILGTVHLALGDNASFGGSVSVPYHQDFVVYGPSLSLFDEQGRETVVLRDGTLLEDSASA